MIIFGRFSVWLFAALLVLTLAAAVAVEHPVITIALVAILAIVAIYGWRGRSSG